MDKIPCGLFKNNRTGDQEVTDAEFPKLKKGFRLYSLCKKRVMADLEEKKNSENQHAVAITEKRIPFPKRLAVCVTDILRPRHRSRKHQHR